MPAGCVRARLIAAAIIGVVLMGFSGAAAQDHGTLVRREVKASTRTAGLGFRCRATSHPCLLSSSALAAHGLSCCLQANRRTLEFRGEAIHKDLEAIVAIARGSLKAREVGAQMYGRISGFPSGAKTAAWSADQFRGAGIGDVRVQPIAQDPSSSFWMPVEWEVRLLGDGSFGAGTADVVPSSQRCHWHRPKSTAVN